MASMVSVIVLVPEPARAAAASALAYERGGYTPREVAEAAVPYQDQPLSPRQAVGIVDAQGVRMFQHTDGRIYNHPVAQAQYGISLLNTHRVTGDAWFLDRAQLQANRLVDTHIESRSAWWYPYPFTFELYGIPGDILRTPWYSAMAQGQALSLFTRLHLVTGQPLWRQAADATFTSMTLEPVSGQPWSSRTDGAGYLWLEEYPRSPVTNSERVLNGHIFALYGLWDYWRMTGDDTAAALFDGALTTAARYIPNGFRNTNWASSYSLRNDRPHERYHGIHIGQLLHAHVLTGATVFASLAETLQVDFPKAAQTGSVQFAAARHTGVKFASTATGVVTATKTIEFTRATSAPGDQRRRIQSQSGYWLRITTGSLAGYWVQEVRSVRVMSGVVARIGYLGTRRVELLPGTYSAYTASGAARTVTFTQTTSAAVTEMGWTNARQAVLVHEGMLAGHWLPLSGGTTLR
jgi:hypothetical protein